MDVDNLKDNHTGHLEVSPKSVPAETGFEGLTEEETKKLEKKRECFSKFKNEQKLTTKQICTVVRKIDVHLISSLCLLFIFDILDRSNIANARLGGMQSDLGLTDTQYQTAVAIMVSTHIRWSLILLF